MWKPNYAYIEHVTRYSFSEFLAPNVLPQMARPYTATRLLLLCILLREGAKTGVIVYSNLNKAFITVFLVKI